MLVLVKACNHPEDSIYLISSRLKGRLKYEEVIKDNCYLIQVLRVLIKKEKELTGGRKYQRVEWLNSTLNTH